MQFGFPSVKKTRNVVDSTSKEYIETVRTYQETTDDTSVASC